MSFSGSNDIQMWVTEALYMVGMFSAVGALRASEIAYKSSSPYLRISAVGLAVACAVNTVFSILTYQSNEQSMVAGRLLEDLSEQEKKVEKSEKSEESEARLASIEVERERVSNTDTANEIKTAARYVKIGFMGKIVAVVAMSAMAIFEFYKSR